MRRPSLPPRPILPQLIEVLFKGNRKEFFLWESDENLPVKAPVVVEADRGEDLGYVLATGELAEKRAAGVPHGPREEPVSRVIRRRATSDDLQKLEDLRSQDESTRRKAMERVRANALQMKLTDAEWRWDRKKLTIYFTAEKRVDFRNLVRELASAFRTRIELKQIGVRDEAKRLNGIGRCGREYCSASWLPDLRPVNLGVAKDQRLSLNPSQISGACGRLMCCLRYEHEFYVAQRKRFPKEGKPVTTSLGSERVVSNDIFRERVTLRNIEGELRTISLLDLRREMGGGGTTVEMGLPDEETPPIAVEGLTDEIIRLQDTQELPAYVPGGRRPTRRLPVIVEVEALEEAVIETDDFENDEVDAEDLERGVMQPPEGGADGARVRDGTAIPTTDAVNATPARPSGEGPDDAARERRGRRRRGRRGGRGGRGGRGRGPDGGGAPDGGASGPPGSGPGPAGA